MVIGGYAHIPKENIYRDKIVNAIDQVDKDIESLKVECLERLTAEVEVSRGWWMFKKMIRVPSIEISEDYVASVVRLVLEERPSEAEFRIACAREGLKANKLSVVRETSSRLGPEYSRLKNLRNAGYAGLTSLDSERISTAYYLPIDIAADLQCLLTRYPFK